MSMKPLLAGKATDLAALQYPVLVSPKLDGVRALVIDGVLMSRTLKPIPNAWCQRMFSKLPTGTDGELIYGDPTLPGAYLKTTSAVMSEDGEPTQVVFHVFDNYTYQGGFRDRFRLLTTVIGKDWANVAVVPHSLVEDVESLTAVENIAVEKGFEGVMIRSLNGKYKQGRSTEKEGILLKLKRFSDAEAVVESVYAWQHNGNLATTNALGRTERSSHQDNKTDLPILGGLNVRGLEEPYKGVEFSIGTGFSGADDVNGERGQLWRERDQLIGRIAKFKYFPTGSKDRPRFPVFIGWRDGRDM